MTPDFHSEFFQQAAGECAGGHPSGGFARASPLQNVAGVLPVVLQYSDQVGVAGPRPREATPSDIARLTLGRHHFFPVRPVAVVDQHRDWSAERLSRPDTAQPFDAVPLDLHPGTAAISHHPAGQLLVNLFGHDRQSGREPFDDCYKGSAVRFTGGEKPQRHLDTSL